MRKKLLYSLVGIMVLAFGGLIATLVAGNKPALGLDLQGGISVTQQAVPPYNPSSLDLAVDRIRDRVDSLGVAEPEILRQGDAIVVNLPGVKNQKQAEELVKVTGQLYLRPVLTDPQFNIPCVTGDPNREPATTDTSVTESTSAVAGSTTVATGSVAATDAPTTTAAGGPARRPSTANTSTTAPGTTTPASTIAPSTTVAADGSTTTVPTDGATTTTVAGDATNLLPPVAPEASGYVKARGGSVCYVGPAGGTGEVFKDDAAARDLVGVRVGCHRQPARGCRR